MKQDATLDRFMSFTGCTEKPDLVARADMALAVKRRKAATLTLQRAAHAKIAAMDSARLGSHFVTRHVHLVVALRLRHYQSSRASDSIFTQLRPARKCHVLGSR